MVLPSHRIQLKICVYEYFPSFQTLQFYNLEPKLWQREKYWQAQLFTVSKGMNCDWDWYSNYRKGYRK